MQVDLIQTLRDKNNPEKVISEGPFKCTRPHAWLGFGYYFWDTHEDLGHWWGTTMCNNSYIICKASAYLDSTCWDLHNNQKHLIELKAAADEIVNKGMSNYEKLKVPEIIEFIKKKGVFKYKAIRALGLRSISSRSDFYQPIGINSYDLVVKFDENLPAFMDLLPPIQICLLEKTALSLNSYRIIYPPEYKENESDFI